MDMALAIVLIVAFLGIILVALVEATATYNNMKDYAQDISDETVFYFKSNPVITCKILAVHRQGYEKPNMTLEITYPDKSVGEFVTPLSEFENLWNRL